VASATLSKDKIFLFRAGDGLDWTVGAFEVSGRKGLEINRSWKKSGWKGSQRNPVQSEREKILV